MYLVAGAELTPGPGQDGPALPYSVSVQPPAEAGSHFPVGAAAAGSQLDGH